MSVFKSEDIRKFVLEWNTRFPLDLWWRLKYKIPYGSQEHRETSFIDMRIEYEEDKIMRQSKKPPKEVFTTDDKELNSIIEGEEKEVVPMSDEEITHEFDNVKLADEPPEEKPKEE